VSSLSTFAGLDSSARKPERYEVNHSATTLPRSTASEP
jgi:hypothetical protein